MLFRRSSQWVAIVILILACAGCGALDRYRGEGFDGDEATWGAEMRPEAEKKGSFFFNEKSRQIEESLGM
jgi:hypothetical protein